MAIAERRLAAEFNRPGHADRRPLDLRHLLRRRPPGGHRVRGRQPRRAPEARQARDALRRQPGPARRPDRDGLLGGRPGALPGVRLADPAGQGRHRRRRDRGRDPPRPLRRPALDHRRAHRHRLRLAEQGRQPEGPRRAARPRRGPPHQGGLRLGPGQDASSSPTPWPPSSRGRSSGARSSSAAGTPPSTLTGPPSRPRPNELERRFDGDLAAGWDAALPRWEAGAEVATRNASADTINALAAGVPELFGGSADLSESNLTDVKGGGDFSAEHAGRNLRFGVREHGMGGIANGLACHGGFRPYVATFLTFSDYMRGSVRAGRPLRTADRLRLDPRLGGPRRGRAHPPAGRALRGAAGDPEPLVRPAGRRQRDGGRLGARPRADGRADGAGAHPPEAPRPAGHGRGRPRGRPARRVRRPRSRRPRPPAAPRSRLRRDRLRGPPGRRGRRGPGGGGDRDARRLPPLLGGLRGPGRRLPRERPPGGGEEARRRRDRRLPRLGALDGRRGGDRRPRPLRHLGPGGHDPQGVRLHGRGGGRRSGAASSGRASTAASAAPPSPAPGRTR